LPLHSSAGARIRNGASYSAGSRSAGTRSWRYCALGFVFVFVFAFGLVFAALESLFALAA